ncbi:MAG: molybdenum cofactor biosynthesis protein MoaE [Cytophagales bacterium]|nr:molybdenum cofactor biosynthesis protein MoaE [Bernardetiaceae bacterium]MDW8205900.1 molybdenum cofactor biosynthesis protein MoaE [Cytophagales bacterium]
MIVLTTQPIEIAAVVAEVSTASAGAIDIFIGTVRKHNHQRKVLRLEYEAYAPMALQQMEKIAQAAKQQWQIEKLAMVHRTGTLLVGEVAVVIAVSTAHRQDAFEACRYIIDTLKKTVPIWKKEYYEDGAMWIDAHP